MHKFYTKKTARNDRLVKLPLVTMPTLVRVERGEGREWVDDGRWRLALGWWRLTRVESEAVARWSVERRVMFVRQLGRVEAVDEVLVLLLALRRLGLPWQRDLIPVLFRMLPCRSDKRTNWI